MWKEEGWAKGREASQERSQRDGKGVGRQGFITEVKPMGLGDQLSVEIEKMGQSRLASTCQGN